MELDKFNAFMNKFIMMLINQQTAEERLGRQIRGYEAWGETQAESQRGWLENALEKIAAQEEAETRLIGKRDISELLKTLFGATKEGVKGLDLPPYKFTEQLQDLGIPETYGVPLPTLPEEYPQKKEEYQNVMRDLAISLQTGEYPREETIKSATQILGSDFVNEWLAGLEKTIGGRAEREIRGKEYEAKEEGRKLGWAELKQRIEEGKGKANGKKTDAETLKALIKERNSHRDKAANINYAPKRKEYTTLVDKETKQINALQKKMGMKSDEEYQELADKLKLKGYTNKNIREHPDLIKDVESKGYTLWVLMGYL